MSRDSPAPDVGDVGEPEQVAGGDPEQLAAPDAADRQHRGLGLVVAAGQGEHLLGQRLGATAACRSPPSIRTPCGSRSSRSVA